MLQKREQEATIKSPQQSVDLGLIWHELESIRSRLSNSESNSSKAAQDELAEIRLVSEILKSRRRRDAAFGAELFGEPAWDLLLELYLAQQQQRRISVSDACRASASPPTTGLRWIGILEVQGWVRRACDPLDGRRMWISLTDRASAAMHDYLEQMAVRAA